MELLPAGGCSQAAPSREPATAEEDRAREGQVGLQEQFLCRKGDQTLARAAQGVGESPSLEVFKERLICNERT